MSKTESNELPRRPRKVNVWGTRKKTILMMNKQEGHQFLVEKIDEFVYELTICTYSEKAIDSPTQQRTEYVMTTNEQMLRMLVKQIKECCNF